MVSVNGISPVYICSDCISIALILPECVHLVGTRVSPQYSISIDVLSSVNIGDSDVERLLTVGIRFTSTRMIDWKP